jgi:hypothetical protein
VLDKVTASAIAQVPGHITHIEGGCKLQTGMAAPACPAYVDQLCTLTGGVVRQLEGNSSGQIAVCLQQAPTAAWGLRYQNVFHMHTVQ